MAGSSDLDSDFRQVQDQLLARWPENRVAPDLGRISALVDLLGNPQDSAPVIHVAGTNGKTSTSRIIESLLRAFGLSTGLFTSPSLESLTERVQINGEPISLESFVAAYREIEPMVEMIDQQSESAGGPPMSMFEVLTGLAFAAFADAPVDVMVIEVGLGGTWDATNVLAPAVSVITPIGMDHMDFLGDNLREIAGEKAGVLSAGAPAVFARQEPEAAAVLLERAAELGLTAAREGIEFAVVHRAIAVGGQQLTLQGIGGEYDDIYLPLHGEHQAGNAVLALAAVESFLGAKPSSGDLGQNESRTLNIDVVRQGMAESTSPGRLERVRTSPTVLIDAAHNPHGAAATAAALAESFDFQSLIGVVAVLTGKDAAGILRNLEPVIDTLIVTRNSSPRSMPTADLVEVALDIFGQDRVLAAADLPSALEHALELADEPELLGAAGIVAFGSVVTVADARRLLRPAEVEIPDDISELDDEPGGDR